MMTPGFMLISYRRAMSPYNDPISVWDMKRVLQAAARAGVDLDSMRIRTWDVGGTRRSVGASLGEALASTYGWHVYDDEAAELARLLPDAAEESDDPLFIRQMAAFFEKASRHGGFFVF